MTNEFYSLVVAMRVYTQLYTYIYIYIHTIFRANVYRKQIHKFELNVIFKV